MHDEALLVTVHAPLVAQHAPDVETHGLGEQDPPISPNTPEQAAAVVTVQVVPVQQTPVDALKVAPPGVGTFIVNEVGVPGRNIVTCTLPAAGATVVVKRKLYSVPQRRALAE